MTVDLTILIAICGGITTISAACAVVYRLISKSITKIAEEVIRDEMHKNCSLRDSQLVEIGRQIKDLQKLIKDNDTQNKQAFLALIRERINQIHQEYFPKGWIGAHTLFVVEELYTMYKMFGGNSFIDRQMQDIRSLEVKSVEEELHM